MSAAAKERPAGRLLYESGEWNFDTLKRTYDAIEEIAIGELGLDPYPNQIEMISAEQMIRVGSPEPIAIICRRHFCGIGSGMR